MSNKYIEALKQHGVSNVGSYNTTKNLVEIKTQLYNKLNKMGLANYKHHWLSGSEKSASEKSANENSNSEKSARIAIKNYVMKLDNCTVEIYDLNNTQGYQITLYSNQLIPYGSDEHKYLLEIYNQLII